MLNRKNISKIGIGGWGIGGFATSDPFNNDDKQIEAIIYALNKGLNLIEINFWNAEGHSAELIKKALQQSSKKRLFLISCYLQL